MALATPTKKLSIHSAVMGSAQKMAKGCRECAIEPMADGKGLLVTHHMHDYEHPMNGTKVHVKSHAALKKHLEKMMPLKHEEDEEDD